MHVPGELIGLVAVVCIFGIPLMAIWTEHRRKILELKLRLRNSETTSANANTNVTAAIEALRAEVQSLRDTTTQYDMSFDSALQRMEQRVEGLERRVNTVETNPVNDLRAGR